MPEFASLRSLLGGAATDVAVDVGRIVELLGAILDAVPHAAGGGRGALCTNELVDARAHLSDRGLDVRALREASSEEDGVDTDENPRAALEQNRREKQADPKKDLKAGDNGHGRVVVLLDEGTNLVLQRAAGLGPRRGTAGSSRGVLLRG